MKRVAEARVVERRRRPTPLPDRREPLDQVACGLGPTAADRDPARTRRKQRMHHGARGAPGPGDHHVCASERSTHRELDAGAESGGIAVEADEAAVVRADDVVDGADGRRVPFDFVDQPGDDLLVRGGHPEPEPALAARVDDEALDLVGLDLTQDVTGRRYARAPVAVGEKPNAMGETGPWPFPCDVPSGSGLARPSEVHDAGGDGGYDGDAERHVGQDEISFRTGWSSCIGANRTTARLEFFLFALARDPERRETGDAGQGDPPEDVGQDGRRPIGLDGAGDVGRACGGGCFETGPALTKLAATTRFFSPSRTRISCSIGSKLECSNRKE